MRKTVSLQVFFETEKEKRKVKNIIKLAGWNTVTAFFDDLLEAKIEIKKIN